MMSLGVFEFNLIRHNFGYTFLFIVSQENKLDKEVFCEFR